MTGFHHINAILRVRVSTCASTVLALATLLVAISLGTTVSSRAAGADDTVSIPPCPLVTGQAASGRLRFGFDNGTIHKANPTLRVSPPQCTLGAAIGISTRSVMVVRNDSPDQVEVYLDVIELVPAAKGNSFVQPATDPAAIRRARQQFHLPADRVKVPAGKRALVPFDLQMANDSTAGIHAFAVTASMRTSQPGSSNDGATRISINTALAAEILVTVPGFVRERAVVDQLKGPRIVWHDANTVFRYRVLNGGSSLIAGMATWRSDAGGLAQRERVLLLPRGSRTITASWKAKPFLGRYRPTVTLRPHPGDPITGSATYPAVWVLPPWWLIALVAIAVLLPFARQRRRAHTRARRRKPQ